MNQWKPSMAQVLHIGIDDTDSTRMGCTTYVAALLVERLSRLGTGFVDYPSLVRLNPNVPWKTRGNGALCLRVNGSEDILEKAPEIVVDTVERESDLGFEGTDPGVVFYRGETIPSELTEFARRVIQDVVEMREALGLIRRFGAEAVGFKSGRGIIGALAAVGETLPADHTYELITYRVKENRGKPREVDPESVFLMDDETAGLTFDNVDAEKGRILITPRGPDPVLYGIRGESAGIVKKAHEMVVVREDVERWVIFRTNQGTDAHLRRLEKISQVHPHRPVIVRGTVSAEPRVIPGRHVIFTIDDGTGRVDCAAYEPTGKFRNVVKKLVRRDLVEVYGGVRPASSEHSHTINLEKIRVLNLTSEIAYENPICPNCGKRMKSMGKNKGFRCEGCGHRDPKAEKIRVRVNRDVSAGLYIPPSRAHRHLTKPLSRYGKERSGRPTELGEPWHHP